jgi:hypothetical protein
VPSSVPKWPKTRGRKWSGSPKSTFSDVWGHRETRLQNQTEVWSYASGNGFSSTVATADVNTTGQATRYGNQVYGSANSTGFGTAVSTRRFCTVNVVMTNGLVSAVNYQGPTGGLLTAGEQCAFAVDACVKK